MPWNFNNDRPIYSQLLERIQMQIVSGYYQPGDKLPSVRDLASIANVNPNTMQKAFAELERMGFIQTQRTSGRTVTEDLSMIQQMQQELAQQAIHAFFSNMKELGYTKEQIISLIEKSCEEGYYDKSC